MNILQEPKMENQILLCFIKEKPRNVFTNDQGNTYRLYVLSIKILEKKILIEGKSKDRHKDVDKKQQMPV